MVIRDDNRKEARQKEEEKFQRIQKVPIAKGCM
jgi:hypothetical protein